MDIDLFDYELPPALIAQFPAAERTHSRLLSIDPAGAALAEVRFSKIRNLLKPGDVLVANNTRVVPARVFARKPTGGKVEIMLERILGSTSALVQLRSNKPVRAQQRLVVSQSGLDQSDMDRSDMDQWRLVVIARRGPFHVIECAHDRDVIALFQVHGTMPLPPYINRVAVGDDFERYQTVYCRATGAVAAPTAGLHFDRPLIDELTRAGIHWVTVTLHVGAGTFQPVRVETVESHKMHREWIEVEQGACDRINQVKSRGGRVISVGTTAVRALESAARSGLLEPYSGDTALFILPGFRFNIVDALITNFHLPRSTLLMMVCAFAGYEKVMTAYRYAIDHHFRFYSYGDAMFVERQQS